MEHEQRGRRCYQTLERLKSSTQILPLYIEAWRTSILAAPAGAPEPQARIQLRAPEVLPGGLAYKEGLTLQA